MHQATVSILVGKHLLEGFLAIPENSTALVVFVHGSGSSRHSPRNQAVAEEFNEHGLSTLLFDLLTPEEEEIDMETREIRFDIPLLAERVCGTLEWLEKQTKTKKMRLGLIGSSTGAAAALVAAAKKPSLVSAVVSRGGRPDLGGSALPGVQAPTLLIVGQNDPVVLELNRQAMGSLVCVNKLELVSGATHLFEEPGTLQQASRLARGWFLKWLY